MNLAADEISRQLDHALERWNALSSRGLQSVGAAALVEVLGVLGAALEALPLNSPYRPGAGVRGTVNDLRDAVRHLAAVVIALRGRTLGGVVSSDPTPLHFRGANGYGLFRVDVTRTIEGSVSYLHVVNREVKKAGITGHFDQRMGGSYNCLRKVIAAGPPYLGDPWKRHAPTTILAGHRVELWAREEPSRPAAKYAEDLLNEFYRGEWSKEGWKRGARRPTWPAELNRKRAGLDP